MSDPFCDAVAVTTPEEEWHALQGEVLEHLDAIGMSVDFQRESVTVWRTPDGFGTVKAERRNGVRAISASGAVCAGLRAAGRFAAYLATLGARPHRVTRVDASLDVQEDAPPVLDEAARKGRAGAVALTRKSVRPKDVTTFLAPRADGVLTGTAYFGTKDADVRLAMYDKRQERMDKGLMDVGPLTRYELRLRAGTGVTLSDAYSPREVFWHFMPACLLSPPEGVAEWVAGGTGFDVERVEPLSPAERLRRRVVDSADVIALTRLAIEVGPNGLDMLLSSVRSVYDVTRDLRMRQ